MPRNSFLVPNGVERNSASGTFLTIAADHTLVCSMDRLPHFVSALDPTLARSASSWSSASGVAPVDPESSASFEG